MSSAAEALAAWITLPLPSTPLGQDSVGTDGSEGLTSLYPVLRRKQQTSMVPATSLQFP